MSDTTTDSSIGAPAGDPETPRAGSISPLAQLRAAVLDAAVQLVGPEARSRPIALERPPSTDLGDYSTNAALTLASLGKRPPRELAEQLGHALAARLQGELQRYEVAGPGFLNLFLSDGWHRCALDATVAAGARFGGDGASAPERMLVEFVSANPTGPMHVGHARNAAYGDSLARLLSFHGHDVEREFYVNDAGSQIVRLGESIGALARGEEVPEDGYRGEYVQRLADAVTGAADAVTSAADAVTGASDAVTSAADAVSGASDAVTSAADAVSGASDAVTRPADAVTGAADADPQAVGRAAVDVVLREIEASLARFNVLQYDHWQRESALHDPDEQLRGEDGRPVSAVEHTLQLLHDSEHTYRSEGALWLRTTDFGDDKDRVLIRSTGEHTYFASDIAYHQSKRERGYQRQIDVWGADHHGYLPRMRAAYEALGGDPQELEMLTMQLVHLLSGGERSQMSKRAGTFVTLDDLVQEIGVDAARWYLLSRSHDTTVDLDLDLATRESSENPVYYVQYAHARIASMLRRAGLSGASVGAEDVADAGEDVAADPRAASVTTAGAVDETEPLHPSERAVIKALLDFPGEVQEAADRRAPHRIAAYALALAQEFTAFYRDCRVLGATPASLEAQRVSICVAVQGVLARALDLLGVSAPVEM